MKIGIFSDIHDNLKNLEKALGYFQTEGISQLIFCGDFCSPIPITAMAQFPGNIHAVFGNNDGDRFAMRNKVLQDSENIRLHGEYGTLEIERLKISFTHYPFYGHALAKSGDYDLVCAGHTHKPELVQYDSGIFLNPGDIMGLFDLPTIGIFYLDKKKGEILSLEDL